MFLENRKELSELYNEENLQIYTFLNYDKDYFYENAWKANFTYFSRDQLGLQVKFIYIYIYI